MNRRDREDVTAQTDALDKARRDLAERLDDLATDAADAARTLRRGKRPPTRAVLDLALDHVHMSHRSVNRAEEALDLAAHDLHTAQGGDA